MDPGLRICYVMFCSAKSRKLVFLANTTVIPLYIHLRTMAGHYGYLRRPGSSFFMSNKFMPSCAICLVIVREIFLIESDCSAITKVHNKFKNNNKHGNFTFAVNDQLMSFLFPVNVSRPKFAAAGLPTNL